MPLSTIFGAVGPLGLLEFSHALAGSGRLQSVLFEPVVQIRFRCVIALGNELLCRTVGQQTLDFWPESIQLAFPRTPWPSKLKALLFLKAQRLLGPL